jgi:hypothetical protein
VTLRSLSREQFLALAQAVVARGGLIRCRVHGQSMRPRIADDDNVVLGPVRPAALRVGDVVLAHTARGPKLHRVVARGVDPTGPWLTLRGDTQVGLGQKVRHQDVLARLVRVERGWLKSLAAYTEHYARRIPWLRSRPDRVVASSG